MIDLNKITLSYAGSYGKTFEAFIDEAYNAGFRAVQLIPDQEPNLYSDLIPERVDRLRHQLYSAGMRVSVHNVFYDLNIVSLIPEVQDFAVAVTRRVCALAKNLGAEDVTVHPGYMFSGWRSSEEQTSNFWAAANIGMGKLAKIEQDLGLNICLENGSYFVTSAVWERKSPLHIGITLAEMKRLVHPNIGPLSICLDVGKLAASGEDIGAFAKAYSTKIKQVQIGSTKSLASYLNAAPELGWTPEIVFEGGANALRELLSSVE